MFTDHVKLQLAAGKGGNGVVAWRREKYIPKGGPCGGDGGKGGSIILETDTQVYSLENYRNLALWKAQNGGQGGSNNRKGKNGEDLILKIPCGTLVKDSVTGKVLRDVVEPNTTIKICRGGRGGKGNTRFKTPTNRAPNQCTPGKAGELLTIELELKLIADVGLVGLPNAGKSTLFTQLTNVPVKIAPYPFTTRRPNVGYYIEGRGEGERILIADIPGIIEGAHLNKGLGHSFLRHIERTNILLYVIDVSLEREGQIEEQFLVLQRELGLYNPSLLEKHFAILLNKIDLPTPSHEVEQFMQKYRDHQIFAISGLTGQGIEAAVGFLKRRLSK